MYRELQLRNLSSRALFGAEAYWMFKDRDEAQERTNGICNDKKILWERDEKGRGQLFEYMSLEKGLDIWNFLPEWNWATKHFQKWLKKILFCFKYGNYAVLHKTMITSVSLHELITIHQIGAMVRVWMFAEPSFLATRIVNHFRC